ncbi:probable tubulin polyglutamylase TTLL1 [Scaptodrosophila lebanonensis]|uniref:Polyglutamylase complex subunit TTLL1 n=1 Tax=Drosophila lebanonensis TaxID=7225 RepID=A0A6J2UEL9_DROLE|nr:probable tubulin polyglutamylase TTLL1 [Scaptodrosophila lebanonensis]
MTNNNNTYGSLIKLLQSYHHKTDIKASTKPNTLSQNNIKKQRQGKRKNVRASQKQLLYSTDWEKSALVNNFRKRGWQNVPPSDGEWNFYWAGIQNCRYIFCVDHPYRMRNDQMINHFPNSTELSRKDLLLKNIKRYRKDLERKGDPLAAMYPTDDSKLGIGGTRYIHLDIIPMTFVLPADYNLFVKEYQKSPSSTWIVKPSSKSQGVGIFLVNNLSKLKKYACDARTLHVPHLNRATCVISKYIDNPLLIGGKKFDLRLFVLVTTYNPLKAYLYKEGFCRFCTEKYDQTEIDNLFMHLTNVSIQKTNKEYNDIHGGKWPIQNLWLYLDSIRGEGVSVRLWSLITETILHSLNAVAPMMANDPHCFEVYGYDIIIDNNLKPWLIEINTSPSMHSTTNNDRTLKYRLIDNVLDVVLPPSGLPDIHWDKTPDKAALRNFTLLTSETEQRYKRITGQLRKSKGRAITDIRKRVLVRKLARSKPNNLTSRKK